ICQMAFHERGYTHSGVAAAAALEALSRAGADGVGANCGRGVRCVAAAMEIMTQLTGGLLCAYPNAGLPEYVDGRYLFGSPLPHLGDSGAAMAAQGVNLVGGCCGTTPEYIARIAERLKGRKVAVRARTLKPPATATARPAADLGPEPPAGSI